AVAFGEDNYGELYVATLSSGRIYKVVELCSDFSISLTSTDETCDPGADGTVNMDITGGATPFDIVWSNADTSEDLTGLNAGTYIVTIKDDNNCARTDTIVVGVDAGFTPTITASGDMLTATAGVSYQWYLDANAISGATGQTHLAIQTGDYTVDVTDNTGCTGTSDPFFHAVSGIPEVSKEALITAYPNPFDDYTMVRYHGKSKKWGIKLFDVEGKMLRTYKGLKEKELRIDRANLPTGTYFLEPLEKGMPRMKILVL
ncbi:MAG: T9SS type A sorting domain-containing protein, partial [Bacteroidetes bacterium]|nr:T9SS type A sorting domain-containing protein [Bacteroidota bacterium]